MATATISPIQRDIRKMGTELVRDRVLKDVSLAWNVRHRWRYRTNKCFQFYRFAEGDIPTFYAWQSKVKANMIRPTVERIVAVGTDARPGPVVLPRTAQDVEKAKDMQDARAFEIARVQLEGLNEEWQRHMWICGLGVKYVGWNPFEDEMEVRIVDPRAYLCDVVPRSLHERRWGAELRWVSRDEVIDLFGSRARKIQPGAMIGPDKEHGGAFADFPRFPTLEPREGGGYTQEAVPLTSLKGARYDSREVDDPIQLVDYWRAPEPGIEDGEPMLRPGWRVIVAGDEVLEDDESPFRDWKRHRFPHVTLTLYEVVDPDPNLCGPHGIVEDLIPIQKQVSRMLREFADHFHLEARPWLAVPEESGITERVLRDPRHLIKYRSLASGDLPKWIGAQSMAGDFAAIFRFFMELFDFVAGVHEPDRGQPPGEVRSGVGIKALQSVMQQNVRLGVRHNERAQKLAAQIMTERIAQFWTRDRVIRITDAAGQHSFRTLPAGDVPVINPETGEPDMEEAINPETGEPDMEDVTDAFGQAVIGEGGLPQQRAVMVEKREPSSYFGDVQFDTVVKIGSMLPQEPEELVKLGADLWMAGLLEDPGEFMRYTPFKMARNPQRPQAQGAAAAPQPGAPPPAVPGGA